MNPGGSFKAFQTSEAEATGSFGPGDSLRSHWKPFVDTSGLNAESGMREESVRLANTVCSMTRPRASHSWVFKGMAVDSSIHSRYP